MKIIFLGTGDSHGIPIIKNSHPVNTSKDIKDRRLRSSVYIEWNDLKLIIDCGPDFRQQVLNHRITNLDALLFTHEHADHTAGIDDTRPFCFDNNALPIYLTKRVYKSLKKRYPYIFHLKKKYPSASTLTTYIFKSNTSFFIKNKNIIPIKAKHGEIPVHGFRIGNTAYLTDIKTISEKSISKLKNLDVLILNALRKESHSSHLNIDEACLLAKHINAKQTYFTHINYNMGFHKTVNNLLPKDCFLAYDNLTIVC